MRTNWCKKFKDRDFTLINVTQRACTTKPDEWTVHTSSKAPSAVELTLPPSKETLFTKSMEVVPEIPNIIQSFWLSPDETRPNSVFIWGSKKPKIEQRDSGWTNPSRVHGCVKIDRGRPGIAVPRCYSCRKRVRNISRDSITLVYRRNPRNKWALSSWTTGWQTYQALQINLLNKATS